MIDRHGKLFLAFVLLTGIWLLNPSSPSLGQLGGNPTPTEQPSADKPPSETPPADPAAPPADAPSPPPAQTPEGDRKPDDKSAQPDSRNDGGNLVRNGGFENPRKDAGGWHDIGEGGGDFVWNVQKNASEHGRVEIKTVWQGVSERGEKHDQSVDIDYQATLWQAIPTVAGQKYVLAFAYAHNPDGSNPSASATARVLDVKRGEKLHEAKLTHSEPATFDFSMAFGRAGGTVTAAPTADQMNFRRYQASFIATGSETRLEFESHQSSIFGFVVDDVSVVAHAAASETLPDATAGGKYRHLLRTIRVPDDAKTVGQFNDRGQSAETAYGGEKDLPPGYWVYAEPYWYIWKSKTSDVVAGPPASKTALKRRAIVTLGNGDQLRGDIVEENAASIVIVTKADAERKQVRIERDSVTSIDWLPSAKGDDARDGWLREIPANLKLDPATSPMCVSWERSWLVHRYDMDAAKWQTFATSETPIPEPYGRGASFAIGKRGVVILDRQRDLAGWALDFATGKWQEVAQPPVTYDKRNNAPTQAAVLDSRFVVWGFSKQGPQGAVYDLDTHKWSVIADAPIMPRYRAATAQSGSKWFIWYGYGPQTPPPYKSYGPLSDGAIYDVATNAWEKIPEPALNVAGYGLPCVEWDGRLVVVGDGRNSQPRVGGGIYDPEAKTWETIGRSPGDLGIHAACAIAGNRLFVWSGNESSENTPLTGKGAVYDFSTRRWKTIAPAPIEPRVLAFTQAIGNKVVVYGGWITSTERFVRSGAIYDLDSDTWETIPDLPTSVPKTLHPGW